MEKTTVEWLFDNLNECFDKFDNGEYSYGDFLNASKEVKEQANKMFEQQIIDDCTKTTQDCWQSFADYAKIELNFKEEDFKSQKEEAEQYYNETFNKDENK